MICVYKDYLPGELDSSIILKFLQEVDNEIIPKVSSRVDLCSYATKLASYAHCFTIWNNEELIGLCAVYINKAPVYSYATYICVKKQYQGEEMLGVDLFTRQMDYVKNYGSIGLRFGIRATNKPLLRYYQSLGFDIVETKLYDNSTLSEYVLQITF